MIPRKFIAASLVATAMFLAQAAGALALTPDPVGLDVSLYQADVLVGSTVTDATGSFIFEGLAAGPYKLVIADLAATMSLQFMVEVAPEEAPANIVGQLTADPEADFGLSIRVNVISQAIGDLLEITGVRLSPRKWNRNYAHSLGKVRVVIHGTGLEAIQSVTLQSATGIISTIDLVLDPIEGTAVASFQKSAAYAALVPADAVRGSVVPVDVLVASPAGVQTFSATVTILGRKKP